MFGYAFSLTVTDPEVAARLAAVFAPFAAGPTGLHHPHDYRLVHEPDAPRDPWLLTCDGSLLTASPDRDAVVEYLVWHVNTQALSHAPDRVLVHAGAVVRPGGGAVVLVGPSGAGKSTLVTALVRAGWGYLSDELAVIDPASRLVEPHARRIHLKPGSPALPPEHRSDGTGSGSRHLPVDEVRPGATAGAQPLVGIVRLEPRDGGPAALADLSAGAGASALTGNVLNASDHHGRLLAVVADLALGAVSVSLRAGDLSRSVAILEERLGAEQSRPAAAP